jgi:hypothetical protein
MADIDEISKAFGMFNDGVRSLQLQRSLNDANDQVQQIKSSELKEADQVQQIRGVANDLTRRLVGMGVNAASIEEVSNSFKPQQPSPFEQAVVLNQLTQSGQTTRAKQQQDFTAAQGELNRKNALKIAGVKADGAAKTSGKVEVGLIKDLQAFDTQLIAGHSLLDVLKSGTAAPGLQNVPIVTAIKGATNPQFAEFQTYTNQYFDAYRRAITGMAAAQSELEALKKTTPNVNDTPRQFEAKLKAMMNIGSRVRKRFLINLKKSGRNVEGWMQPGSAADAATGDQIDDFHATAPGVDAPQGAPANDHEKYFF